MTIGRYFGLTVRFSVLRLLQSTCSSYFGCSLYYDLTYYTI